MTEIDQLRLKLDIVTAERDAALQSIDRSELKRSLYYHGALLLVRGLNDVKRIHALVKDALENAP